MVVLLVKMVSNIASFLLIYKIEVFPYSVFYFSLCLSHICFLAMVIFNAIYYI